ncbi:uncharacterized protein LOC129585957 [Paramacrobiotus metropolitanus]|uniref:uncharacterized protein LOC129585957 n=1 Tax=Paramacrobiotus metropolitanus TaxID=2943436 RepID=UPI002446310A|nr:uncharacterized protein LOC129585957 [Paramacrobiotus metropolitanus]XP_055334873.1 uncharacterized protein LOC129585957 [Paramacrobiotus metropolitanus]XP_055334874.1 uncharacterized protein LOC129585957 [Paramacrobiotus metropolitanus]
MDFGKLLDLAKKNQDVNKDQLMRSKDPVLEFKMPGRETKSKPNLSAIQARLQAHQERLRRQELEQTKSSKTQAPGARPNPVDRPGPGPSRTNTGNTAKPKPNPTPSVASGATRPSSSTVKQSEKPNSSKLPLPKPVANGKPAPVNSDKQIRPSSSSSRISDPQPNRPKPAKPLSSKPAAPKPTTTPGLSFQQMLRLAEKQQKEPVKDDVPLLDPLKMRAATKPVPPPPPPPAKSKPDSKIRPAVAYSGAHNPVKVATVGKAMDKKPTKPPSTVSSKADVRQAPHSNQRPNQIVQRGQRQPDGLSNGMKRSETQSKNVKPGSGGRIPPLKKQDDRFSGPKRDLKNPHQVSNGVKRDNRGNPIVQRGQPSAPSSSSSQQKSAPAGKPSKLPPKSGASTSTIRPAPKSAYPEKFDPFRDSLKKRPKPVPSTREEDEDEYDDDMDDFIDDTPYDDDYRNDYSEEIRKMFRYDPRRYVGREDLDDIDNMESNIHQQWKEEAISAYIGRKEDEREEELERQELARERARKKSQVRKIV